MEQLDKKPNQATRLERRSQRQDVHRRIPWPKMNEKDLLRFLTAGSVDDGEIYTNRSPAVR